MVASLTFELPDASARVRPVLKVNHDIRYKDYILTATFEGSNAAIQREDVPPGLQWSTSLECPFVYLPDAQASINLYLDPFLPPSGARTAILDRAMGLDRFQKREPFQRNDPRNKSPRSACRHHRQGGMRNG